MSFNRFALFIACLLLALGWAVTAQAKKYYVTGGGAQLAIGAGLPLPIQTFPTTGGGMQTASGTNFPPLLIPVKSGATVLGTTAMTQQQRLAIPNPVLSRVPVQNTVGLFAQNPTLYAVATNLGYTWPAVPAVLSTNGRTGLKTTVFSTPSGNTITYSNPLASKFGGPARFRVIKQFGSGWMPNSPVTIYAVAVPGPGNPPCTHTAFGGANNACLAALGQAIPNSIAANGGPAGTFNATPGGTPNVVAQGGPIPGVGPGKFGATPLGTVTAFVPAVAVPGFTNMASSFGYPATTGMLTLSAPFAAGAPEVFMITGGNNRTAGGAGTVSLVSGALSQRARSGPNGNRGWIRLQLQPISATPTMSPAGIAATAGLMLLAVGYVVRRRLSS